MALEIKTQHRFYSRRGAFGGGRLIVQDHSATHIYVTVKAANDRDILANVVVSREEWQRIAKAI